MSRLRRPSPQAMNVLSTLHERAAEWTHGYELCRTLDLKAGTVYPILMRLADRGLVETMWEQDVPQGRPARHLYRLSSAGAEFIAALPRRVEARTSSRAVFVARPGFEVAGA